MTELELLLGSQTVRVGVRPIVMGIVNVTPDSFSDGGKFWDPQAAIAQGERLVGEGADWLDIGGESTRPGAEPVSVEEELRRVLPVLEGLLQRVRVPISIDTYKHEVARRVLPMGVAILNDVTGFRDPRMIEVAAESGATCICMHMRGTPRDMQEHADYANIVEELLAYFEERISRMTNGGIDRRRIIIDPGIGFAKKRRHNLEVLRHLDELGRFGRPVLLGASRKRILGELTGEPEHARLYGTIATVLLGWLRGVSIFRVHDVAPVRQAIEVALAIEGIE